MPAISAKCFLPCTDTAVRLEGRMSEQPKDLDGMVDQTERLGVVGSPSSTAQLALDILGSAVTRKLVGELALFRFMQDASPHYALGQITEIQLRNIWHE